MSELSAENCTNDVRMVLSLDLFTRFDARLFVKQEVADSPYSVVVPPSDAHGPASSAYGTGVSTAVATLENMFYVQASSSTPQSIDHKGVCMKTAKVLTS